MKITWRELYKSYKRGDYVRLSSGGVGKSTSSARLVSILIKKKGA